MWKLVTLLIVICNYFFPVLGDATVDESDSDKLPITTTQPKENEPPNLNSELKENESPTLDRKPEENESTNFDNVSKEKESNDDDEDKEHIESLPFGTIAPDKNIKINSNNCNSNRLPHSNSPKQRTPTSICANVQYSSDVGGFVSTTVNKQNVSRAPEEASVPLFSRRIGVDPVTPQSNRKIMSPGNNMAPIIGHNKVMPLDAKAMGNKLPPIASNKISPFPVETEIPPENRVVCTVDIHREKTPSVTSSITSVPNSPVPEQN